MFTKKGFTVIELIVTVGIITILSSLVTINLVTTQRHTSLAAAVLLLQSDLKQQQLKAMDGDTGQLGSSPANYGLHFETDKYTLFRQAFVSGAPANFVVKLDSNLHFTTLGDLTFSKGSGEIIGPSTITLEDGYGNHRTLNINHLGVVTSLN